MVNTSVLYGQELEVSGRVTSAEEGYELPGVNVLIKGTSTGTITDIDGYYNIKVEKTDVLVFSFIGMKTVERGANASIINITMESDMKILEEIVKIGYGEQKKKEVTGAVARVSGDEVRNFVSSDIGNALQGRIAGVNVSAVSGAPGSESSILIRGVTSLTGANTPLYVVDGVPQDGDPRLSPSEIESIDVLKDAASAAVYGTRGAAGVILITTRNPVEGNMRVSFDGSYGVNQITSSVPLMSTNEQIYFEENQRKYAGAGSSSIYNRPEWASNNTDLYDFVQNDFAATQQYSMNISGGSNEFGYNVTLGAFDQDGTIVNSYFKRYNVRVSTQYNRDKWRWRTSMSYTYEDREQIPGNLLLNGIRYRPYQEELSFETENIDFFGSGTEGIASGLLASLRRKQTRSRDRFNASSNLSYELGYGFSLSSTVGVSTTNQLSKNYQPPYSATDIETGDISVDPTRSSIDQIAGRMSTQTINGGVNYTKQVGDHRVIAMALMEFDRRTNTSFAASIQGLANDKVDVLDNGTFAPTVTSIQSPAGLDYVIATVGTIGRVMYDYKSKYLLTASIRRDGSSNFSKENRWGVFPAFSVAWNVADENFWKPLSAISDNLKIRASYGTVGNERIPPYSYLASLARGNDYVFGNIIISGTSIEQYPNTDVKWETSVQYNLGADIGFLKNRIIVNTDFYYTEKKDMLFPIRLPLSAGTYQENDLIQNVGNMVNKGIELAATYQDKLGDFSWALNGTFSKNVNEVTSINGNTEFRLLDGSQSVSGDPASVSAIAVGREVGYYHMWKTNGVIKSEEQLKEQKKLDPDVVGLGDVIRLDINGDGIVDDNDKIYSGSPLPDFEVGANLVLAYKNFDFTMNWYASVGHEIVNGSKAYAYRRGRHRDLVYMWTPVNPESDIPILRNETNSSVNMRAANDLWVEDGSFLRLRTATIGYSLPRKLTQQIRVSRLRIYATAQNALTFTNYDGFNPEVGGIEDGNNNVNRGLDRGTYPISAVYMLGLQLTF
ncbi:SusC/RagA family TonB-linked outer membrane protein [Reichenbachiella versicolor]|uniref:SusC/RagA family TonB-linked outer membrane protein n=1 Tax=Reichenbachiella versicolor TaxID=1821036 RepID=UPI0013A5521C|nr:TonB-dependent receptor [Reichenbachiella versicolor]